MDLEVSINRESIAIRIENPFRPDLDGILSSIDTLAGVQGAGVRELDIQGLLPLMLRGIAGCEAGCPADAQRVVSRGYQNFTLQYIEGGIMTASAKIASGALVSLKLFPEF